MTDGYFRNRDGLMLHYRDSPGSDAVPPLLCLPGLTRNTRDFDDLGARYAPRFRVLALDFRGRALSDPDPDPRRYHPLTYVNDVIELLDFLAVDRAIFVGTSLGGIVTMIIAGVAPQRIAAAVLNDIGPDIDPTGLARIRGYVGKELHFASWAEAAERIAANNGGLPTYYGDEDWLRLAHRTCRDDAGSIRFDYDIAIAAPFTASGPTPPVDMWPLYRALVAAAPVLIVRGERSDLLSAPALTAMVAAGDTVSGVTVAGAGHAPDLGEPEALAALDDFLGCSDAGIKTG